MTQVPREEFGSVFLNWRPTQISSRSDASSSSRSDCDRIQRVPAGMAVFVVDGGRSRMQPVTIGACNGSDPSTDVASLGSLPLARTEGRRFAARPALGCPKKLVERRGVACFETPPPCGNEFPCAVIALNIGTG